MGACGQRHAGWELRWGRDARIQWDLSVLPPCDVFQANFRIVPATPEAYKRRSGQIASMLGQRIDPDVIAFQEVCSEGWKPFHPSFFQAAQSGGGAMRR
jgi:hypothetical protein